MPTYDAPEWEYRYINPDGQVVTAFKAYENATLIRVYADGSIETVPNG